MTTPTKTPQSPEKLVVAFHQFHDVFLARVSNQDGRQTHAFGATQELARQNALKNYRLKYSLVIS